jgi:hypothetical protein
MFAATTDIVDQGFRPQPRRHTIQLRLRRARVRDERCVQTLSRTIETLLRDLEERLKARQLCSSCA